MSLYQCQQPKKQNLEASLNSLRTDLEQLQTQLAEQQNEKETLDQELTTLQAQRQQLQTETQNVQVQIQTLEQTRKELHQSLCSTETQKQQLESQLNSLHTEFNQLQSQVLERQNNKEQLEQELVTLEEQRRQLESALSNSPAQLEATPTALTSTEDLLLDEELPPEWAELLARANEQPTFEEELPPEWAALAAQQSEEVTSEEDLALKWSEFMDELTKPDIKLLQAIAEEENPVATVKNIAQANQTTSEVMINSINERARDTLGAHIIDSGANPPVIADEEHLSIVKQLLTVYAYLDE